MQLLHPLDISQLVGSQEAAPQLRVGVLRKPVRLHQIGDEAHCRLPEGMSAMLPSRNAPSALVNQARGYAVQNGGSLSALLFAGGASLCCAASMLHVLSLGHHM